LLKQQCNIKLYEEVQIKFDNVFDFCCIFGNNYFDIYQNISIKQNCFGSWHSVIINLHNCVLFQQKSAVKNDYLVGDFKFTHLSLVALLDNSIIIRRGEAPPNYFNFINMKL